MAEGIHRPVDVNAKPSGWPPANLDSDSGRGPQATSETPTPTDPQFQVSTHSGDCRSFRAPWWRAMRIVGCWLGILVLMSGPVTADPFRSDASALPDESVAGGRTDLSIGVPVFRGLEPSLRLNYD